MADTDCAWMSRSSVCSAPISVAFSGSCRAWAIVSAYVCIAALRAVRRCSLSWSLVSRIARGSILSAVNSLLVMVTRIWSSCAVVVTSTAGSALAPAVGVVSPLATAARLLCSRVSSSSKESVISNQLSSSAC